MATDSARSRRICASPLSRRGGDRDRAPWLTFLLGLTVRHVPVRDARGSACGGGQPPLTLLGFEGEDSEYSLPRTQSASGARSGGLLRRVGSVPFDRSCQKWAGVGGGALCVRVSHAFTLPPSALAGRWDARA